MTRNEAFEQARMMKGMGIDVAVVENWDAEYDVTLMSGLDEYLDDGWSLVKKF